MSNGFTRRDIESLARLAQLELDDQEIELLTRQLGDILQYARHVQEIDTTGVPPTSSIVPGHDADRADTVRPSLTREEALANAPDPQRDAGLFRVPRVIG